MDGLLAPYRVLDLTSDMGSLCAKILGDLGCDVIKIERPGGDASRNIGPFYHDVPDGERSLFWFAHNTSKRGITLNIELTDGQEIFKRLAKTADFVIESFPPGYMDKLGIGYPVLSQTNPQVILTSITPFGQTGPFKDYKTSDCVAMAMGGLLFLCGDPDRPPLRCTAEQAYCHAGIQAAVGALIAHHHQELHGKGQHVDVSVQESVVCALNYAQQCWDVNKVVFKREGAKELRGPVRRRVVWQCKDGYVCWHLVSGDNGRRVRVLVEAMDDEGMAGDLKDVSWETIDWADLTQEQVDDWEETFARFFLTHTSEELHEEAVKRGTWLFPASTTEDLLKNRQLMARDFWVEVVHPELGTSFAYPGAPFELSEACWSISRRAPLIGEHNEEIYGKELGFSREELIILKQGGVI